MPITESMSRELEIRSSEGDSHLVFSGDIPRDVSGEDGCSYDVTLEGRPVSATVAVYDIQPQRWAEFFTDLARNWRGWSGEKSQASLEGHLSIAATSDSLGHVSMRVVLRGDFGRSDWQAERTIFLEGGQLERLAKEAGRFFGYADSTTRPGKRPGPGDGP